MSWDVAVGYFSGLYLIDSTITGEVLWRTVVVINICDAVMCNLLAYNNGHRRNLWTVLGFIFGIWAVAILLVLPKRPEPAPR